MKSAPLICYVMSLPKEPWFCTFKMSFHEGFTGWAWERPGCKWNRQHSYWKIPLEYVEAAVIKATELGFDVRQYTFPSKLSVPDDLESKYGMRPYQDKHAYIASIQDRWIEGSEMGLGKCPIALVAGRMKGVRRGLVIDTAMHKWDWYHPKRRNEFDKWWPGHPPIETIKDGEHAATSKADIRVVNYHLLHKLDLAQPIDFLWLDECHMLQNPQTMWSKAVRTLLELHPDAWVVGMTGTLIPNDIMTMHNVLDTIWPGRFGNKFDFGNAYALKTTNDFGRSEYYGINPDRKDELRERLTWISARTTKQEAAKYLPPFVVRDPIWIRPAERVIKAVEWANDKMSSGAHHVTVLTHLRKTAFDIADRFRAEGREPIVMTGEDTASRRAKILYDARSTPTGIIVATLHSLTTGVDLTFAPVALLAEIYPRPVSIIQLLGRFNRMSGSEMGDISIFAKEGGDMAAESLFTKIQAISSVWKAGLAEEGLVGSLDKLKNLGLSEDQINALLSDAATEFVPDEF